MLCSSGAGVALLLEILPEPPDAYGEHCCCIPRTNRAVHLRHNLTSIRQLAIDRTYRLPHSDRVKRVYGGRWWPTRTCPGTSSAYMLALALTFTR
jgi:hypothetical protein